MRLAAASVLVALVVTSVAPAWALWPHDLREYIDLVEIERRYGAPQRYNVPMRDGTLLSTVVVLPRSGNGSATFPVVLDRSPYGHFGTELLTTIFLPFGFAAVMQDLRGSGRSEGQFSFWRSDGTDGYDTIKWIAAQPWSNGRVYQTGFSADGMAALAGGINEAPPELKGQWIAWASATGHNSSFQGGVWVEGLLEGWLTGTGFPYVIDEVKAEEQYSNWWSPIDITWDKMGNCHWPTRIWAGWYDIFQQGTIDAFIHYQDERSGCGNRHKIMIDPHGHCIRTGDTKFPRSLIPLSIFQAIDLFLVEEGKPPRFNTVEDVVTFYVMGPGQESTMSNYWTTLPNFPQFTPIYYYFRTGGGLARDRVPETTGRSSFVYDPNNPQPTLGGHLLLAPCGQFDQRELETRSDVLVFTSDVLTEPLFLTGRLNASLFVSTSGNDTDIYVKLIDVYPDGRAMFIADGIKRLRWRYNRDEPPVLTQPGAIYEILVDLWTTAYVFEPDHAVRVHISSSSYARFSANYNNGLDELDKENGSKIPVTNTIFFSPQYPSRIELPLVQPTDIPNNYEPGRPHADMADEQLKPWEKILSMDVKMAGF